MGGHRAGEVASRHVACRIVEEAASLYDEDTLATCLRRLNDELFDEMSKHPGKSGMGATVAGIVIATSDALVFNVGDSRIYREQDGFLRQLSVDDRPMAPPGHRVSHRLTQALGGAAERTRVDPHISRERLSVGRRYLICSDGLSDSLDPDSMESCLVDDDAATVTTLFEKATERGGEDNISILLLRVDGGGSSASDAVGHEKRE